MSFFFSFFFNKYSVALYLEQVLVAQSCKLFCDPMDCSLLGSSVLGILQARLLEWVAIFFSRGSSPLRNRTQVSCITCKFRAAGDHTNVAS